MKPCKRTVLHMTRLNQIESRIFVILCVLCFQRQSFSTFIVNGPLSLTIIAAENIQLYLPQLLGHLNSLPYFS